MAATTRRERVLVVEPDSLVRHVLVDVFIWAGFQAAGVGADGADVTSIAAQASDVVLLGLGPDGEEEGIALCTALRSDVRTHSIPLLVLIASRDPELEDELLTIGADDVLRKPLREPKLVVRRVETALRHSAASGPMLLRQGPLQIDLVRRQASCGAATLELTPTELEILLRLAERAGAPVPRSELARTQAGTRRPAADESSVNYHVFCLRRKLGPWHALVQTVRGVGYRLNPDVRPLLSD